MDIVQQLQDTIINETPARYPDVIRAAIDEIKRLRAALAAIAAMPDEDNEWDGRDKFWEVRAIAQNTNAT